VLDRAWSIHSFQTQRSEEDSRVCAAVSHTTLERIVARRGNRVLLLDPAAICFFRMENGLVKAQTVTDSYSVNYTIGELEAGLPTQSFFKAHRSALVNLNHIAEIHPDLRSTYQLVMSDRARTVVEVSERQGRMLRSRVPGL
jgi:DNA-binding LytR/AlgR family response regulator